MKTSEVSQRSATGAVPTYVIGIDVGGTFTDAVCSDGATTWRAKSPTNPARFSDGVRGSCTILAEQIGVDLSELLRRTERFGLGTTAVTNVLATRRGRNVGLITTKGFEGHLHSMRNHRDNVDGWLTMRWNPVHLDAVRGVPERIDRDGKVCTPLDITDVEAAARDLVDNQGVDAFAVSFLWSVRNPVHESQAAAAVRRLYPKLPVFSGVELHPLIREYERTTLAVLNAFTSDALDGVEELEAELKELGLAAPVLLLHSGGGAISVREARSAPIGLASSGPAAGAVAAGEVAIATGRPNALCCDMGGTSIDVAVVTNGIPERRSSAEIGGIVTGQSAIDVESIGAGGGSIAWIDARGMLRVGPQSARATPGPVCYGRGGTEPTVTDAMILLGYIDPRGFMGGGMKLNIEAAREACERLGRRIGLGAIETAHGIREIALAEMGKAMRARIASGGIDVRNYGVIAFGGSGSLFATSMARELELAWVLTPVVASVLSAYGAATADIRVERTAAVDQLLPLKSDSTAAAIAELKTLVDEDLAHQGVTPENRELICSLELRFLRQRASLTLNLDSGELNSDDLLHRFRMAYSRQYGDSSLTEKTAVELSTATVTGVGKTVRAVLPENQAAVEGGAIPVPRAHRSVYVTRDQAQSVPVYDSEHLRPGHTVQGPALIDTGDTTLWVPIGASAALAAGRSMVTTFEERSNG